MEVVECHQRRWWPQTLSWSVSLGYSLRRTRISYLAGCSQGISKLKRLGLLAPSVITQPCGLYPTCLTMLFDSSVGVAWDCAGGAVAASAAQVR